MGKSDKKTLVCSWKKLWTQLPLLEVYKNSDKGKKSGQEESLNLANQVNIDSELFETIVETLVNKPDDLIPDNGNSWLVSVKEENIKFVTWKAKKKRKKKERGKLQQFIQ